MPLWCVWLESSSPTPSPHTCCGLRLSRAGFLVQLPLLSQVARCLRGSAILLTATLFVAVPLTTVLFASMLRAAVLVPALTVRCSSGALSHSRTPSVLVM